MDESGNSAGTGAWLLRAGKGFERAARRFSKALHPSILAHNLRWQLMSHEARCQSVRKRLHLDQSSWLFILGLNNSGTTLVVDLLKSHPTMRWLPNEGQYLTSALPLVRDYGVPRKFSQRLDVFHWTEVNDPAPALRAQYDWSLHYQPRPGILLEKSPPSMVRSRWLQANFTPSRFIAIIRHPYAVCEGIRRREGHSIADAAEHWTHANQQMLADIEHLRHCLRVSYEDLCARPEEMLRLMQDFLELEAPIDPSVVTRPRRIHNIDGTAERIRNFNERSLQQLSRDDISTIDRIAGPLMQRLGYSDCVGAR